MKSKKGFEIQFNWIFVLIAGSVILLFFIVFVMKQKSIQDSSTEATALRNIESIMIGAGINKDTTDRIDMPNLEIGISCDKIGIGSFSKQYQNMILFAPSSIKGTKLIWQTLDFSMPYKSANLLYITGPKIRYIIIGNTNLAREINKTLPLLVEKEFYEQLPVVRNENSDKVRFIILDNAMNLQLPVPNALEKMNDLDVTAVEIQGDSTNGELKFYQKSGPSWTLQGNTFYAATPSLIGAVYSDNLQNYECNMRNAFSRSLVTGAIHGSRLEELNNGMDLTDQRQSTCSSIYARSRGILRKISDASRLLSESKAFSSLGNDMAELANEAKNLEGENTELQKYSCPLIY